ncbi:hypothetical protein V2H45_22875 [Tumidithrix elongata RA019]|uniref:Lipoprotein n=1 Tax=Tumidithrix elongata BACA0141 TaxID=2716417 RepID=A0AAW9Q7W0_9CYAN|nr:hypothetical protein [Tumidithrix elongata RA019]
MKRLSLVLLLGSMGMLFAGCSTSPTVAVTAQISPLVATTQAKATTTTQSTEVATDSQKLALKVGDISELKDDKTCDDVGETLVYAETKSYLAYICGNKRDVRQPELFRVKARESKKVQLEGKALISWNKDSFVGIVRDHTFKLNIPSNTFLIDNSADPKLTLSIRSQLLEPIFSSEKIIRFLKNDQFMAKKDEVIPKELSQRILQDLNEKGKQLSDRCRKFDPKGFEADKYSKIFPINPQEYLVAQYYSSNTKNPEYIYWLATLKEDTVEATPLLLPLPPLEAFQRIIPEYQVNGRPNYDSDLGVLSIYVRVRTSGELTKYQINGSQAKVIEFRWIGDCKDSRCLDPVFFFQLINDSNYRRI